MSRLNTDQPCMRSLTHTHTAPAAAPAGRRFLQCTDPAGSHVLVKALPSAARSWEALAALENEGQLLRGLAHFGIPRLLDSAAGWEGQECYLVQASCGTCMPDHSAPLAVPA